MSRRDANPDITPELMLRAYAAGIFPMAESKTAEKVYWVDPRERGILPLDKFHAPKSLRKTVRQDVFEVRCNSAFAETLAECGRRTANRRDTWINPDIERCVLQLYARGFAHSVECWRDGKLVGGLYGISLGAAFFGESMFSRETDASKVALVHLVARLKFGGFRLLDTQFVTDHLARFGVIEIPARDYLVLLEDALKYQAVFPTSGGGAELDDALAAVLSD
ncbi:MAG: leucyl/phenylalanyl-tRNA--protein transferase [Rhodospirillaceae bacterium]